MAAAREQAEKRRLDWVGLEVERGDVAVQMVDGREWKPKCPRESFGRGQPHEERADQPWPARDGNSLDVAEADVRLPERLAHDRRHELEMPPGSDLGDDPSVASMQGGLRGDDIGEDLSVLGDESSRGLVTRGLQPEDHALSPLGENASWPRIGTQVSP